MWLWVSLLISSLSLTSGGPGRFGKKGRKNIDDDFVLHRYETTWMKARKLCQRSNSDLVIVDTEEKQKKLEGFLDSVGFRGKFWIGATDFLVEDKWCWTNGEYFTYTNWAVGEPNDDSNQDCLQADAITGKWDDAGCDQFRSFLCERARQPGVDYRFYPELKTWFSARRTCENQGGFLAIIDHSNDHLDVALRYHGPNEFWIGGANFLDESGHEAAVGTPREWRWINGVSVKTSHWAYGSAPVRDSRLCMVNNYYGYGQFYGEFCEDRKPFLCQRLEADPCRVSPCLNGGQCEDLLNGRRCHCEPGFLGDECQIEVDDCVSNACLNGGICRDEPHGFECRCLPGFRGRLCETNIDECDSFPCLNHGTCHDAVNGFLCQCPPQYGGRLCQEPAVDPCLDRPCLNDGVCLRGPKRYFECICAPGFDGPTCDLNVDECASSPCLNGGTCIDGIAGYVCSCLRGYDGPNCQLRDTHCDSNPCLHGGVCEEDDYYGFRCHCPEGILGSICEDDVDECLSSPCQNGASCVNEMDSYSCICPSNVFGKNCQMDYNYHV